MFSKAYSADGAMLVLTFAGTDTSDIAYAQVVDALQQLHRDATGRTAFTIIVVPKGHAAPNAHWRSRFADVHRNLTGRNLLALVTENPLIRGVFTAINWMIPEKGEGQWVAVSSFDEAVRTFEKAEGQGLDQLRVLFAETEEAIRSHRTTH